MIADFSQPMNTHDFIRQLDAHTPADHEEATHRRRMTQFISSHANTWWLRANSEGHVTGSAWIINSARTHALLLHHLKLNLWVQPGGHLDATDPSPAAGALREAREETGISNLILAYDALFDVDIHAIPARVGEREIERAHLHYDVRYLIITDTERFTISDESLDAKWILLEKLAQPSRERSIARMAEKSLRK